MQRAALVLFLAFTAALCDADGLRAQRPAPQALTQAQRTALAEALIGSVKMVVQHALHREDLPAAWGPQRLLEDAGEFGFSPEQRRALEALETRMEQAFFRMLSQFSPPDTTLVPTLWGDALIDVADVALAGFRLAELENQAALEFARIEEEMRGLLTDEQRQTYRKRTGHVRAAYAAATLRPAAETAAMLLDMAEHGMLTHPLLLARSRADELGLTAAEQQRLDALGAEFDAALAALAEVVRQEPVAIDLSVAEIQAMLDTVTHDMHVIAFATELLRLRDETYQALADDRAAALAELQADLAMTPYRPRRMPPRPCRSGGSGGGLLIEDGLHAVYGLAFQDDSARIRILVIGRGDGGRLRSTDRPAAQGPIRGAGGSMGRWIISHDEGAARLWIHETPLDLGDANVVILDLENVGADDVPTVVATLRIDPVMVTDGCATAHAADLLRDFIAAHPDLQPYLHR